MVAWSVPPVKLNALLLSVTVLAFITPPERFSVAPLVMPNSPAVVLSVPAETFIVAPTSAIGAVGTTPELPVTWPAEKLNVPPVMIYGARSAGSSGRKILSLASSAAREEDLSAGHVEHSARKERGAARPTVPAVAKEAEATVATGEADDRSVCERRRSPRDAQGPTHPTCAARGRVAKTTGAALDGNERRVCKRRRSRRDAQGPTRPTCAARIEIAKTTVATSEADDRSVCERRRSPRDA